MDRPPLAKKRVLGRPQDDYTRLRDRVAVLDAHVLKLTENTGKLLGEVRRLSNKIAGREIGIICDEHLNQRFGDWGKIRSDVAKVVAAVMAISPAHRGAIQSVLAKKD